MASLAFCGIFTLFSLYYYVLLILYVVGGVSLAAIFLSAATFLISESKKKKEINVGMQKKNIKKNLRKRVKIRALKDHLFRVIGILKPLVPIQVR